MVSNHIATTILLQDHVGSYESGELLDRLSYDLNLYFLHAHAIQLYLHQISFPWRECLYLTPRYGCC